MDGFTYLKDAMSLKQGMSHLSQLLTEILEIW